MSFGIFCESIAILKLKVRQKSDLALRMSVENKKNHSNCKEKRAVVFEFFPV